jgi:hypothetical protein
VEADWRRGERSQSAAELLRASRRSERAAHDDAARTGMWGRPHVAVLLLRDESTCNAFVFFIGSNNVLTTLSTANSAGPVSRKNGPVRPKQNPLYRKAERAAYGFS